MLTSFIMIVMVFSKGGVRHGLALLACQLVVMPVLIFFGPFVSSLLGLTAAAVGTGATIEALNSSSLAQINDSQTAVTPPAATPKASSLPVQLPVELVALKEKIQIQQPLLFNLKKAGTVKEAATGYLVSDERADIPARKAVQQENVWRKQVFKQIATLTHKTLEEVEAEFSRLAAGVSP